MLKTGYVQPISCALCRVRAWTVLCSVVVGISSAFRQCRQRCDHYPHRFGGFDQISQHCRIDVEMTFVLRDVAQIVRFGKHPPRRRRQPERMREHLKHHISVIRAIAVPPQCRQRKGVGRVVSQIESAGQRQPLVARIGQALGS